MTVNGAKVTDVAAAPVNPLSGEYFLIRKGARDYGLVRVKQ